MRRLHESGLKRVLAPFMLVGVLAALVVAASATANPSPSISAKQAEANQVLAQINDLDTSLNIADEKLNFANVKLQQVQHDIGVNQHELVVARHNLLQSRRQIAKRLVTLYTSGSSSTLEIILGAKNIDDVLSGLDTQSRVSSLDAQVSGEVLRFGSAVKTRSVALKQEQHEVTQLVAQRRAQANVISVRMGERKHLLSSLNGEIQRLISEQEAREVAAAQAARERAVEAQSKRQTAYAAAADASAVGATAVTPEGSSVIASSPYQNVVSYALSQLGVPYVWAGSTPGGGFDCSGLVMWSYAQIGVSLPHSSYAMMGMGVSVPKDELQPGDLVFFEGGGHVGIYIGNGEFVHAPHTGTVVQVSSLSGSYSWGFAGARRIL